MKTEINEGTVVIVSTGQAGTYIGDTAGGAMVLLTNGDIWVGHPGTMREPQDQADLDAAPLNFDRFEGREKAPVKRSRNDD